MIIPFSLPWQHKPPSKQPLRISSPHSTLCLNSNQSRKVRAFGEKGSFSTGIGYVSFLVERLANSHGFFGRNVKIASDSFLEFDGIERKRFELFPHLFIGSTKDKSTS